MISYVFSDPLSLKITGDLESYRNVLIIYNKIHNAHNLFVDVKVSPLLKIINCAMGLSSDRSIEFQYAINCISSSNSLKSKIFYLKKKRKKYSQYAIPMRRSGIHKIAFWAQERD